MSTSFGKHAKLRPERYRTPSPPRSAVEPLSTCLDADATNVGWDQASMCKQGHSTAHQPNDKGNIGSAHVEQKYRHRPNGSMDMFASIALATQPQTNFSPTNARYSKRMLDNPIGNMRQTKRARSEKLPSPDLSRKTTDSSTRPTTSSEQSTASRMREAELLLHFSQHAIDEWSRSRKRDQEAILSRRASVSVIGPGQGTDLQENTDNSKSYPPWNQQKNKQTTQHDNEESKAEDLAYVKVKTQVCQSKVIPTSAESYDLRLAGEQPQAVITRCMSANIKTNAQVENIRAVQDPQAMIDDAENDLKLLHGNSQKDNVEPFKQTTLIRLDVDSRSERAEHSGNSNIDMNAPMATQTLEDVISVEVQDEAAKMAGIEGNIVEDFLVVESETHNGALRERSELPSEDSYPISKSEIPLEDTMEGEKGFLLNTVVAATRSPTSIAVCAACNFAKNSVTIDSESQATSWISCDGCKSWFHFACAGFKSEREVRSVDKYRCRNCKPIHGATTYVRKSSRAHSAIDYAGLHRGVIKTSDDRPEHHYIQPIRDGTISFLPENFARMRPELVTAEYFEKGSGMKEPIVIPATLNPQPKSGDSSDLPSKERDQALRRYDALEDNADLEDWFSHDQETHRIPDEGQDALDMVMPQKLTVRKVAELYGPDEKVEVIDVKSQNGENKKWNMKRWVDYYESPDDNKIVRNVISLEVSQSKLGRLIRRPKIVRDLDLQDAVWPQDLLSKGEYPHVQFYCLMSVADCFTDFHIDFGGSSVFYHILKGKKTFLFIPPKEKHLKKYEEWCMSPAQNWTFLADQTKECYRVDLSEGDTMLIPSGWIHAVWTPENSLVIGGNFLTRMNYAMQLRIAQVEKITGVARKFRYPHFQKLHWYTILKYLEEDPLPDGVRNFLEGGLKFERQIPTHHEFDNWGENSRHGPENYHARYYSQPELDGLAELLRYVLRTVMIDNGSITEGISAETRNAVKKSIPRGHGEPMDIVKTFAIWCAWKRGDEPIPHWAYPGAIVEVAVADKLSVTASKKLAEEAALKAPRRQSARMQSQKDIGNPAIKEGDIHIITTGCFPESLAGTTKRSLEQSNESNNHDNDDAASLAPKRPKITNGGTGSHRKTACESCRRRRRACKHKEQRETLVSSGNMINPLLGNSTTDALINGVALQEKLSSIGGLFNSITPKKESAQVLVPSSAQAESSTKDDDSTQNISKVTSISAVQIEILGRQLAQDSVSEIDPVSGNASPSRPRTKACNYCRKSKVSPSSLAYEILYMFKSPAEAMHT